MKRLLPFMFLLVSSFGYSQMVSDSVGSVSIKKDARLDLLSAKQIEINRRAKLMNTTSASGYRIQVVNTQSRDEANNVKAEMLRRFPELKSYLLYKAPYYKVRVGNFLSRRDAEPFRKMIEGLYTNRSIYLVPDRVEYRPTEDEMDGLN